MQRRRTFLSWLRTGLTSIGLGIAIAKFIIFHTPEKQFIGHLMGQLLILWGICIFFFALIGFRRSYHKLAKSIPLRAKPYQYSFIGLTIVTTILIILSFVLFWIVVEEMVKTCFLIVFLLSPLILQASSPMEELLEKANINYQEGELATTFEDRRQAFNRALTLYSLVDQQLSTHTPDLDRAIADSYFQLGEYPWAILYDERALRKNPGDQQLMSRLEKAQEKQGLLFSPPQTFRNQLISFLLLPQQFELFFWMALLTFSVCSAAIWFPHSAIRKMAAGSTILLLVFFAALLFSYYFIPLEGIIVKSTGFYLNPNLQAGQLTKEPLWAGSKVRILQTANGDWLKIADQKEVIGYVPAANIRML